MTYTKFENFCHFAETNCVLKAFGELAGLFVSAPKDLYYLKCYGRYKLFNFDFHGLGSQ